MGDDPTGKMIWETEAARMARAAMYGLYADEIFDWYCARLKIDRFAALRGSPIVAIAAASLRVQGRA